MQASTEVKSRLSTTEVKRQDRISEFIFFEKLHLRRLRIISAIFYDTLRKHLPFVDFEERIPAVEMLISLHTKLVNLFESETQEASQQQSRLKLDPTAPSES